MSCTAYSKVGEETDRGTVGGRVGDIYSKYELVNTHK